MNLHKTASAFGDVDYLKVYTEIVGEPLALLAVKLDQNGLAMLDTLADAIDRGADLKNVLPLLMLWLVEDVLKAYEPSAVAAAHIRCVLLGETPTTNEAVVRGKEMIERTRSVDNKDDYYATIAAALASVGVRPYEALGQAATVLKVKNLLDYDASWRLFAAKLRDLLAKAPKKVST